MKQISAGIIIYRKTKQGILFLLLFHGGKYWSFPKGKVEEEERAKEAALREVKEETGISRRNLWVHPKFRSSDKYAFKSGGKSIYKTVIYFLARSKVSRVAISPREHRGYGWFTYKEAMEILPYKNLKNGLTRAYEVIRGKVAI